MYFRMPTSDPVGQMIEEKHEEYYKEAKWNYWLALCTRFAVGTSAVVVAFAVGRSEPWATVAAVLSLLVAIVTVVDWILKPKENWALYSKATDLLSIAKIRALGNYDQYKSQLDLVLNTESAALEHIINLSELVTKIESVHRPQSAAPPTRDDSDVNKQP